MQLAFVLYKYFSFGGLQRDFMRIALECQQRGHQIRVYVLRWDGDIPPGFDVRVVPVKALFNHWRYAKFTAWMNADLAKDPVDRVVGFNKMPGLDVYYAADSCFEDKAQNLHGPLYRLWSRYRHFAAYERAVFASDTKTEIMMISEAEQELFIKYYDTPLERLHMLPPGIALDRRAPPDAAEIRAEFRREFKLADDDLLVVQIGSGFKKKGVDRSLKAMASLPPDLKKRARFFVIGQDNAKAFQAQGDALGLGERLQFLKGRSDIPRFLLGADLLIHPAYDENAGMVLLEALVAGLPALVSAVCGYAHYIAEADSGLVLDEPFGQAQLNQYLARMLSDQAARLTWSQHGLAFAETTDLYSLPQRAADKILEE
ncbi:glycosyltransferase family 4 protein [Pseudomonas gingeri]|uniref:Glycosyltransferase family 4 protein n=1 Tax=Pseudomonas gingeri TaxID=117681 RepID=A0A7Y8C277_9PSED|nr:glycosyltransferase family 4 protein [Pseudomonas gingeri]NWB97275.1 glycosyltransferase family 4 protein [Pseudomonas gingeri]NWD76435.1 glycosyltransferase family 4 protein [Pseudomonas gingeri]